MKVRARFPFSAHIMADGPDALSPVADFTHKRVHVRVEFDGENPLEIPGEPPTHFRRLNGLRIEVTGGDVLKRLVDSDDGWPLLNQLVDIANRVLLVIRNFGMVANLEPLRVSETEADRWLRVLRVQVSEDGDDNWRAVRTADTLETMSSDSFVLNRESTGEFKATNWILIEEALQDGLNAGPEREFLVNAIQHLHVDNLRLAVVEVVICLEIVLTQWLREALPRRGVSAGRINELLSPQLDLSTRIGLLVPMLLSAELLSEVNLDKVRQTIKFRNEIVHKTGNLPNGVPPDDVRHGIQEVYSLVLRVAFDRDRLREDPKMADLGRALAAAHGVPAPTIRHVMRHKYHVVFDFPWSTELPSEDLLAALANDVHARILEYDPRFEPLSPAWVVFNKGGQVAAAWNGNVLRPVKPKSPVLDAVFKILSEIPAEVPPGRPDDKN